MSIGKRRRKVIAARIGLKSIKYVIDSIVIMRLPIANWDNRFKTTPNHKIVSDHAERTSQVHATELV